MTSATIDPSNARSCISGEQDARPISMVQAPAHGTAATFKPSFGTRVLLTVDTEEEFDWNGPFTRDVHGLNHVSALPRFQAFCEKIDAHPIYLVDWPIATNPAAVEIIGDAVRRGAADVGVQLHPWVNPPFEEDVCTHNSFAGNLPRELERAKFSALRDQIEKAFGVAPLIYRAGRYGLGPNSADILKEGGIKIDTSVRPLFDYSEHGGPDYSHHPLHPYWVDQGHQLLEAPMTVVHSGAFRQMGERLQRTSGKVPHLLGLLSKLGLFERIAMTPEGVNAEEAFRGLDLALRANLPLMVLSFHSPSLVPGYTPYTRNESDVESLYDWFAKVYAHLGKAGVKSAKVQDVIAAAAR